MWQGQKTISICSCKNLGFNVCIVEMNYWEEKEMHRGSLSSETWRQFIQMVHEISKVSGYSHFFPVCTRHTNTKQKQRIRWPVWSWLIAQPFVASQFTFPQWHTCHLALWEHVVSYTSTLFSLSLALHPLGGTKDWEVDICICLSSVLWSP